MSRRILVFIGCLSLCTSLFAQLPPGVQTDREAGAAPRPRLHVGASAHAGTSPFDPPQQSDKLIVVDSGPGLDTGCTYRSGGPLRINVPIARVVGPSTTTGKLLNPDALVDAGFLSEHVKLTFPVFDIDFPYEIDMVYFNGQPLDHLQGSDGTWTINTFEVDVADVNFGYFDGTANIPGQNTLEIDIDTASGGANNWCMQVDWVQLQFDAIAPIFLVHGIAAQATTWTSSGIPGTIPAYLTSLGVPHWSNINLEANGTPQANGLILASRLSQLASGFGTKECHLLVHSKGGNDSRDYLARYNNPGQLKVLSLHTLSTPFRGSVLADIIFNARTSTNPRSSDPFIQTIITEDLPILDGVTYRVPCCGALNSLRPSSMHAFNLATPFPGTVRFYNYAADADLNDDGNITSSENKTYPNIFFVSSGHSMAHAAYKTLQNAMTIKIVPQTITDSTGYPISTIANIEPDATISTPLPNDLAVAFWSAQHPSGTFAGVFNADHTTIKSQALAQEVLARILADFPVQQP